jgi:hypothetical protein
LNDPPGAAVWGMLADVERTPPVRRPARSEARGLGADAVGMVEMAAIERLGWKVGNVERRLIRRMDDYGTMVGGYSGRETE